MGSPPVREPPAPLRPLRPSHLSFHRHCMNLRKPDEPSDDFAFFSSSSCFACVQFCSDSNVSESFVRISVTCGHPRASLCAPETKAAQSGVVSEQSGVAGLASRGVRATQP